MEFQIKDRQNISKHCFVCGVENPIGLKAKFYSSSSDESIAIFTPEDTLQSYPGVLHGGISATILDETIGRAIMNKYGKNSFGVTIELNIKYKKPVPTGVELKVVGRIDRDTSRVFEGTGELYLPDGSIAVSAVGKYLKRDLSQITKEEFVEEEWFESDAKQLDKINI
ncbi:MAG: PaaI family thioesterase [Sulfurospirillaceae bacterium]|nr:PaaI family thioesterase [Sulfurospirillaceae bacterium]